MLLAFHIIFATLGISAADDAEPHRKTLRRGQFFNFRSVGLGHNQPVLFIPEATPLTVSASRRRNCSVRCASFALRQMDRKRICK